MSKYKQGKFHPILKEKYNGNPNNIIFRSSWEMKLYSWLDTTPDVLQWSSEELAVKYYNRFDKKYHRYFPDAIAKIRNSEGTQIFMIEVKPFKQTLPPKKPETKDKRKIRTYIKEMVTYQINKSKWLFAQEYCEKKGWRFIILSETELGIKR